MHLNDKPGTLSSFTNVGSFVPLTVDRHGTVLREVAPPQFLLTHPDRNDQPLRLTVALIRDLRKRDVFPTPHHGRFDGAINIKIGKRTVDDPKVSLMRELGK